MTDEIAMHVEDLRADHVHDFLTRPIREADRQEWLDGLGVEPEACLEAMALRAHFARALMLDNVGCVVLWGASVDGDMATIWMIGSDYNVALAPYIHREFSREEWPKVTALAPKLQAFPSSKNPVHCRWLEHFGFKKVRTLRFEASSVPFYRYVRNSKRVL